MPTTPPRSTALDTRREELLRSQAAQVTTQQRLPSIKIMAAGAGLYEFSDTQDTEREFQGVVLNSHPRNILWDKEYGEGGGERTDEDKQPACVANDGVHGQPRAGFAHLGLPENLGKRKDDPTLVVAVGTEQITCATCPYNQFGSKRLISDRGNPRGKANNNYKSVYVLLEGRALPFELRLPATSMAKFDKYLTDLINAQVPVQSVLTIFKQIRQERGGLRWAEATFERGRTLTDDEFDTVLQARASASAMINPRAAVISEVVIADEVTDTAGPNGDDDIGF